MFLCVAPILCFVDKPCSLWIFSRILILKFLYSFSPSCVVSIFYEFLFPPVCFGLVSEFRQRHFWNTESFFVVFSYIRIRQGPGYVFGGIDNWVFALWLAMQFLPRRIHQLPGLGGSDIGRWWDTCTFEHLCTDLSGPTRPSLIIQDVTFPWYPAHQ